MQSLRQGIHLQGVYQQGGVAGHLGHGAVVTGDHHRAAGLRFNNRQAKTFVQRWQSKGRRRAVERSQIAVRDRRQAVNAGVQIEPGQGLLHVDAGVAGRANQRQREIGQSRGAPHAVERRQQARQVLTFHLRADV